MGDSQLERSNSFKALCYLSTSPLQTSAVWHCRNEMAFTHFTDRGRENQIWEVQQSKKGVFERLLAGQGLSPAPQIANWTFSHGKVFYSCWTVKPVIVNNPEFYSSVTDLRTVMCYILVLLCSYGVCTACSVESQMCLSSLSTLFILQLISHPSALSFLSVSLISRSI